MATERTTASATSTVATRSDVEFRPLDWWAELDDGFAIDKSPRRTPPIPAFVRLSRLIDPDKMTTSRVDERSLHIQPPVTSKVSDSDAFEPEFNEVGTERPARRSWADSAGRPLFRIGMAAIVAAVVVGISTFGPGRDNVTTVDAPEAAIVLQPGVDEADRGAEGSDGDPVGTDEQARQVLEALVRQTPSGDEEADLSIVGTASTSGTDIRWTATIRNEGPDTAEGPIMVVHTIGSDFELASVAGSGWDCEHARAAGTITCSLDEELATGQRRRLGLVTGVTGVDPATRIPSTMSVVATTADPDLGDNTVNVAGVTAPADDDNAADSRSRSTGAAGQSESDSDPGTDVGAAGSSGTGTTDQAGTAAVEELPRTGSGLATVLGVAGIGLCLAGRRLMIWSARAQTRTLLVAANID